jgi:hypothetical protein
VQSHEKGPRIWVANKSSLLVLLLLCTQIWEGRVEERRERADQISRHILRGVNNKDTFRKIYCTKPEAEAEPPKGSVKLPTLRSSGARQRSQGSLGKRESKVCDRCELLDVYFGVDFYLWN